MPTFRISEAFMAGAHVGQILGISDSLSKAASHSLISSINAGIEPSAASLAKTMAGAHVGQILGMTIKPTIEPSAASLAKTMAGAHVGQILGISDSLSKAASHSLISSINAGIEPPGGSLAEIMAGPYMGQILGMANQAALGSFAGLISEGALGSISPLGVIYAGEIAEKLSVLTGQGSADKPLDREQIRQLWGCYIYVQVWVICLLVLIGVWKIDATASALAGIGLGMTGWSGNSIAARAREAALNNFDRIFPPGSKVASITSSLI